MKKRIKRDASLSLLLEGLSPSMRSLFNDMMHYDQRGILKWWMDLQTPSKKRDCQVLINMVLSDIAEIEYKDTVGKLETGGKDLLGRLGIK